MEETENFTESIQEMIVKIDEVLFAEVENISGKSNFNSHSGLRAKAKLFKLSLKKFHGEAMLFSPFWDSFVSPVNESQTLSDVKKFNYLKSLVEGTAAADAAICGLPFTADNYEAAQKRSSQPQIITNSHMEGLVKMAAGTSDSNLSFMIKLRRKTFVINQRLCT